MKSKKTLWINAYTDTLNKYREDKHINNTSQCLKCHVASGPELIDYNCEQCPEAAFRPYDPLVACLYRPNSAANSSYVLSADSKEKIIKYHEEAVVYLKSIKRFDLEKFREKLLEIDRNL